MLKSQNIHSKIFDFLSMTPIQGYTWNGTDQPFPALLRKHSLYTPRYTLPLFYNRYVGKNVGFVHSYILATQRQASSHIQCWEESFKGFPIDWSGDSTKKGNISRHYLSWLTTGSLLQGAVSDGAEAQRFSVLGPLQIKGTAQVHRTASKWPPLASVPSGLDSPS